MARKTNYGFERREREKARAAKKAERQRQKQEKSDGRQDENGNPIPSDDTTDSAENLPAGDQPSEDKPTES